MTIPKIPVGDISEAIIQFFVSHMSLITKAAAATLREGISHTVTAVATIPPLLLIVLLALTVWRYCGRRVALFCLVGLGIIWNLGFWEPALETMILIIFSSTAAVVMGVPLGILAAENKACYTILMPVLDCMQTMPSFVYLLPAVAFFGLGAVPAIFATIIFAMPHAIRFTCFGLKGVPKELLEAADAFGSTRLQKLIKVQLPIAMPTIMAGINQTILMGVSMVVVAAIVGAKGLGFEVWSAIQRLNISKGIESGLCVVILAMMVDKITHQFTTAKQ